MGVSIRGVDATVVGRGVGVARSHHHPHPPKTKNNKLRTNRQPTPQTPPKSHPQPNLGERVPAGVRAEIVVDLAAFPPHLRAEWDGLREHDVLFLLSIADPVRF